jgi:hypothetical protein
MTVRRADCFSVVVKKAPGPGGSGVFWLVRCGGQGRGRTADLPLFSLGIPIVTPVLGGKSGVAAVR